MITTVTIQCTDFLPLTGSHKFIFILYCESKDGKVYNIEEIGTKTDLCEKYGIDCINFSEWNENTFKGRRCEILLRIFRRPRFKRFLEENSKKKNSGAPETAEKDKYAYHDNSRVEK